MSKLNTLTPIAAVLAISVAGAAQAAENPFALKPAAGVVLADAHAGKEGKCGEGKCGGDKAKAADAKGEKEGKCGEGKCGADKAKAADAKSAKEGKCGEGKCGGMTPAAQK